MNSEINNTYYTMTPTNSLSASWQPQAIINNKIQSNSGITSNWKYRQYIQNNANHIMKYNTMEYIYASGNNPYSVTNKTPSSNSPFYFSSLHDSRAPNYGLSNSDLKQEFTQKQQMNSRMVAPSIPTINF